MLAQNKSLIAAELSQGTGAAISVKEVPVLRRLGLEIWFSDLDRKHGPVVTLKPHGLKSHSVELSFGHFSGAILKQIAAAPDDDVKLARALVRSITPQAGVEVEEQSLEAWRVSDGAFQMSALLRHKVSADAEESIVVTCREVVVPLMAAMAELIGYDEVAEVDEPDAPAMEGKVSYHTVVKRERNPRNRLLCLRLHGQGCKICGLDPRSRYGLVDSIIQVHHIHPLAELEKEREYDPGRDLIPLCPNCHAAVHTRKPLPIPPGELRQMMGLGND